MWRFMTRKMLLAALTLFGITLVVFTYFKFAGGDPAVLMLGGESGLVSSGGGGGVTALSGTSPQLEAQSEYVGPTQASGASYNLVAESWDAPQTIYVTNSGEGFNAIGGSATVNDAAYDLTFFKNYGVNPFIDTEDDNLSTFAIDVDTASYSVARAYVQDGYLPNNDSVRVEEFINYFEQGYTPPTEGAFNIIVDGSPSRFGLDNHKMLRIGLQGEVISSDDRMDATLIFAIDVSGSMAGEGRLGLVKRSLGLLSMN